MDSENTQEHLITCINSLSGPRLNRSSIYERMTSWVTKGVTSKKAVELTETVAIPTVLEDLSKGSETLASTALSFIGSLVQVYKPSVKQQVNIIRSLSNKLKVAQNKVLSRKLMWTMASLQFNNELPDELLEVMMGSAFLFLRETPPLFSLSTVCEALNTLHNMSCRNRGFVEKNIALIFTAVYPWMYNDADRIRELSLKVLQLFTKNIEKSKLLNSTFQLQLKNEHSSFLMQLINLESVEGLKMWSFLVEALGTEMHNVSLLNMMLRIEEAALKSKNLEFRQYALEHWQYIIDLFALNPKIINNSKRIHLMLVPLKSTENKTETFLITKIKLWWHLLKRLGANAVERYNEVTSILLQFCFGGQSYPQGTVNAHPGSLTIALSTLAAVLDTDQTCTYGFLSRSHHILSEQHFSAAVQFLCDCCVVAAKMASAENSDLLAKVIQSMLSRCNEPKYEQVLGKLVTDVLGIAVGKPELAQNMLIIFREFLGDNSQLVPVLVSKLDVLLRESSVNSANCDSFCQLVVNLIPAGVRWNVAKFSAELLGCLRSFSQEEHSVFVGRLWSKFAGCIVNDKDHLKLVDPLTLTLLCDEEFNGQWKLLFRNWLAVNSSIIRRMLESVGERDNVAPHDRVLRLLIETLGDETNLHKEDVSAWIDDWIQQMDSFSEPAECEVLYAKMILSASAHVPSPMSWIIPKITSSLQNKSEKMGSVIKSVFDVKCEAASKEVGQLREMNKKVHIFGRGKASKGRTSLKKKDDFVFIVTPPKPKRVLTEHQKEVFRSKKFSSDLPAMYEDLSQSSQQVESTSGEVKNELPVTPVTPVTPFNPVMSSTTMADEEALLEPPSPMNRCGLVTEKLGCVVGEGIDETSIVGLLKKDLKLRSKTCVEVVKLDIHSLPKNAANKRKLPPASTKSLASPISSSASPSSSAQLEPSRRPGPASVKASWKVRTPADEPHEGKMIAPPIIATAPESAESVMITEPESDPAEETTTSIIIRRPLDVSCEKENVDTLTSKSGPSGIETAAENSGGDDKILPMETDDPAKLKTEPTLPPVDSGADVGGGEANSIDLFADSARLNTKEVQQPLRKILRTYASQNKRKLITKTKCMSPSTQRGAQILEMSRKIQSEPPRKKLKSSSPAGKEKCESQTTFDSPVRPVDPWVRHTYSPNASPGGSILKKKALAEDCDSTENSPSSSKNRRVSFADPEISDSVDIPSARKSRTSRTRRSLMNIYTKPNFDITITTAAAPVAASVEEAEEEFVRISPEPSTEGDSAKVDGVVRTEACDSSCPVDPVLTVEGEAAQTVGSEDEAVQTTCVSVDEEVREVAQVFKEEEDVEPVPEPEVVSCDSATEAEVVNLSAVPEFVQSPVQHQEPTLVPEVTTESTPEPGDSQEFNTVEPTAVDEVVQPASVQECPEAEEQTQNHETASIPEEVHVDVEEESAFEREPERSGNPIKQDVNDLMPEQSGTSEGLIVDNGDTLTCSGAAADFGAIVAQWSVEQMMELIDRHPKRDEILSSCVAKVVQRAFPTRC